MGGQKKNEGMGQTRATGKRTRVKGTLLQWSVDSGVRDRGWSSVSLAVEDKKKEAVRILANSKLLLMIRKCQSQCHPLCVRLYTHAHTQIEGRCRL